MLGLLPKFVRVFWVSKTHRWNGLPHNDFLTIFVSSSGGRGIVESGHHWFVLRVVHLIEVGPWGLTFRSPLPNVLLRNNTNMSPSKWS